MTLLYRSNCIVKFALKHKETLRKSAVKKKINKNKIKKNIKFPAPRPKILCLNQESGFYVSAWTLQLGFFYHTQQNSHSISHLLDAVTTW